MILDPITGAMWSLNTNQVNLALKDKDISSKTKRILEKTKKNKGLTIILDKKSKIIKEGNKIE